MPLTSESLAYNRHSEAEHGQPAVDELEDGAKAQEQLCLGQIVVTW